MADKTNTIKPPRTVPPTSAAVSGSRPIMKSNSQFLPPAKVVCEGYVFTRVCQSLCSHMPAPPPQPCMPPAMHATPCHAHPLSCMPHPCHAQPPPATHAPYHTCPPAMHVAPCHTRAPPRHACPPTTLRHAVNERAVHILLECILVILCNFIKFILSIILNYKV